MKIKRKGRQAVWRHWVGTLLKPVAALAEAAQLTHLGREQILDNTLSTGGQLKAIPKRRALKPVTA